ncbi:MAG: MBL fold metallo-hydrolase [Chloroflexi bacterium]|nr:MBL fold metallo-hydrolase [Chloroflexota bacterium]
MLREPVGRSHRSRRLLARIGRARALPEVPIDVALSGEAELAPGLLAVPAPGHTPGSYCYVDTARGVAFVGDLVISHRRHLSRALRAANANDAAYERTLAAFVTRAPAIGCAGHGTPVHDFAAQLTELARQPRRRVTSPLGVARRVVRLFRFARMLTAVRRRRE